MPLARFLAGTFTGTFTVAAAFAVAGPAGAQDLACSEGQVSMNRGRACCWEGQHWDRRRKQCGGVPRNCPDGWSVTMPGPGEPGAPGCADLAKLGRVRGALDASGGAEGTISGVFHPNGSLLEPEDARLLSRPNENAASSRAAPPPSRSPGYLAPGLSFADPIILGALPKESIDAALVAKGDMLGACLDLVLSERPGATGTVQMRWQIDATGRVIDPRVLEDSLQHSPTTDCFGDVLQTLELPAPGSSMVIATYPLVVRP
jgi:hypothetical protein